jgi:sulfopyruvate decarboxylase subunit beta
MGQHLTRLLEASDIPYIELHEAADILALETALQQSFEHETPYSLLFSPKVWEHSNLGALNIDYPERDHGTTLSISKKIHAPTQTRFEILQGLQSFLKGKIIVSNIGTPSRELYAICDQPSNFYMTGSLGMVSLIGLGMALNLQEEIVVIDGDGSILTNPNALCTIGQFGPENLTIIAVDNGTHGSTGNQLTPAYNQIDLEVIARSFGIKTTTIAYTSEEILEVHTALKSGPKFIHTITKPSNAEVDVIPLTPVKIKDRFMKYIQDHGTPK